VVPHYHHHGAVGLVLFFVDSKVDFHQAFVSFYEFLIEFDEFDILYIFATLPDVFDMQRYFELCHLYSHVQDTETQVLDDAYHTVIHLENLQDHLNNYQWHNAINIKLVSSIFKIKFREFTVGPITTPSSTTILTNLFSISMSSLELSEIEEAGCG